MIIKNKEDRSSAIWRFILITLPAAVLLFFGGFTTGNTFKSHEENCAENLRLATEKTALLESKMAQMQLFFQKTDSLRTVFIQKYDEIDGKLKDIAPDNLSGFGLIEFDRINLDGEVNKTLKILETGFSSSDTLDRAMKSGLEYLKNYTVAYSNRLDKKIADMKKLAYEGATDALKELQGQIDQKQKDLVTSNEVDAEKGKSTELERKLKDCKDELAKLQAAQSGTGTGKSYNALADKIIKEAEGITKDLIPKIKEGTFGKNRPLKEELRSSMNIIVSTAQQIKN